MDGIISFLIISFLFIVIIVSKSNKDDYKNTDSLISSKKSKSESINNKEKQSNKNQVSIIVIEAQEVLRKQELRKRFWVIFNTISTIPENLLCRFKIQI